MYSGFRTERRRHKRLRVNLSVLFKVKGPDYVAEILEGREYEGKTLDLSISGAGLIADIYLPKKTQLDIKFVLFESDQSGTTTFYELLEVSAVVRSILALEDCRYRLGLEFLRITPEIESKINDLIFSPLEYSDLPESKKITFPQQFTS